MARPRAYNTESMVNKFQEMVSSGKQDTQIILAFGYKDIDFLSKYFNRNGLKLRDLRDEAMEKKGSSIHFLGEK